MFKSIRSKLMGGLVAVLSAISLGAVIALGASQLSTSTVEGLIQSDLAVLLVKTAAGERLNGVRYDLQKAIASDRPLPDTERSIANALPVARMYIDQLRLGADSEGFQKTSSAAILAGTPGAPRIAKPTDGKAIAAVNKVHALLPGFESGIRSALAAHTRRTAYHFRIGDRSWDLPGYAYMLKSNHAKWVAALEESIRFETPFKGNVDFARSETGQLLASFHHCKADRSCVEGKQGFDLRQAAVAGISAHDVKRRSDHRVCRKRPAESRRRGKNRNQ